MLTWAFLVFFFFYFGLKQNNQGFEDFSEAIEVEKRLENVGVCSSSSVVDLEDENKSSAAKRLRLAWWGGLGAAACIVNYLLL